jgi:adenylyl-sulfate kinase
MRKPVAEILAAHYQVQQRRQKEIRATNITWHDTKIAKREREITNGHKAGVIWLTGLPSSGKSTIAVELQALLFKRGCNVYVLDGDNVRHGLNKNLGFSPEDREENIRRIGEVATLFADAGFLVITSFISPYRKDRDNVRALVPEGDFIEVFVNTSVDECAKRDPKGLYAKAKAGEIKQFTGISAPYEEPENPEIIVSTEKETVGESAQYIVEYLERNAYIPKKLQL